MIEPTGYTALDLVGYTDKGTYAANVYYVKNDLVHYGGNIWRILIDDTIGITPAEGTNYTLFIGEPTNLVERIIAPLEDNPATVAYQTGRQIIYNDYLYEVIDDIAVGDILIAYEDDPTNANIKRSSPVETQVLVLDGRLDTAEDDIDALETGKADNSVISPVESGTTASRAYAAGAHFIKDNAFCTAKTAIAQGETFTLNTNYSAGDVGARVAAIESVETKNASDFTASTGVTIVRALAKKNNQVVNIRGTFQKTLVLNQWNELVTVPTNYRPESTFSFVAMNATDDLAIDAKITAEGKINIYPVTATASAKLTNISVNVTFII